MSRTWVALLGVLLVSMSRAAIAEAAEPPTAAEPQGPTEKAAPARADSDAITVELITMGTGDLVFEKFGHAALCLTRGKGANRSRCYNYGSTNFDQLATLAWGFLRGRSVFWVSRTTRERMLADYRRADRSIWSQVLPIDHADALALSAQLDRNALPANRDYRYHHFRDNCASRLRDVIDRATAGALSAPAPSGREPHPSYRQLTRRGFAGSPAVLLASDLILGRAADHPPDSFEAMFLPDVLRAEVERRLGVPAVLLYQRKGPPFPDHPGWGGRWVFAILALLAAAPLAWARNRPGRRRWVLVLTTTPAGVLGLLVWFVAVASPLPELRWNEVLLVLMPFDLFIAFAPPTWARRYAVVRVGVLVAVSLLLAAGVLLQPLWAMLPVPMAVALVIWALSSPVPGPNVPSGEQLPATRSATS